MRVPGVLACIVVALFVALPGVAAEPATVDVAADLPLRVAGAATMDATGPTLLLQGTDGAATWRLGSHDLTLVEVEYWEQVVDGPTSFAPQSGLRTKSHDLDRAVVTVTERLDGFTALAWSESATASSDVAGDVASLPPASDPSWTARPDLRVFRLAAPMAVSAPVGDSELPTSLILGRPAPFQYDVAGGRLHLQAADAAHAVYGAVDGYVHGAALSIRHADGLLSLQLVETIEERAGSLYLPDQGWTGPGTHTERVLRYVQFAAEAAALDVTTAGTSAALFAPAFTATVQGHLGVPLAVGTIALGGAVEDVADKALVLSGDVTAKMGPHESADKATLTASGDVTYVRVGGEASSFPVGKAAAAAAGLALLAGLGVALWHALPGALPLFSRMAKDEVLDHKTRSDIYELVRTDPGVTPHDVVSATGVGWSTVMYHLTVLERNELVVAIKDGRYRRYFDRQSGKFANGRKDIVATLKNATTAAIAQHIRNNPGQVQRRLAETFGLAASSVHWHVTRLVKAGLVEKKRAAQSVELVPGPAWEKLDPEDLRVVIAPQHGPVDARTHGASPA